MCCSAYLVVCYTNPNYGCSQGESIPQMDPNENCDRAVMPHRGTTSPVNADRGTEIYKAANHTANGLEGKLATQLLIMGGGGGQCRFFVSNKA